MTFKELIQNPMIMPTDELAEFWGIEKGVEIDFFIALQQDQPDLCEYYAENNIENYDSGGFVFLFDNLVELFQDGTIEVKSYNQPINIFRIVIAFQLQGIIFNY